MVTGVVYACRAVLCRVQESDILYFFTQVHKLQPGFFIALDRQEKKLLWVIRGESTDSSSSQTLIAGQMRAAVSSVNAPLLLPQAYIAGSFNKQFGDIWY